MMMLIDGILNRGGVENCIGEVEGAELEVSLSPRYLIVTSHSFVPFRPALSGPECRGMDNEGE